MRGLTREIQILNPRNRANSGLLSSLNSTLPQHHQAIRQFILFMRGRGMLFQERTTRLDALDNSRLRFSGFDLCGELRDDLLPLLRTDMLADTAISDYFDVAFRL